jgi:hypothetical protein
MAKRASLTDFTAKKTPAATAPPAAAPSAPSSTKGDGRKGQTLRLSPDAWKALKMMAVEEGVTVHTILIAAVNAEFKKRGKPEIA